MAQELAEGPDLVRQLNSIQDQAESALLELRELARGINPAALREFGPAVALRALADASSVPVQVRDEGIGRSPDAIEAAIYFCAREAIQNAVKHAGAGAHVTVALARDQQTIEFMVSDDGTGMQSYDSVTGIGITGMSDRIGAVGGHLEIRSAPGQGTTVHGTIPRPGKIR